MNIKSAEKAVEFIKILQSDSAGKPKVVSVPGHQGRNYHVIVRRENGLSVECLQNTPIGPIDCQGNSKSVCYHSLAAIMKCAELKNQTVYFYNTYQEASLFVEAYRCDKPVIVALTSRQSGKKVYCVVVNNTHAALADWEVKQLEDEFIEAMQSKIEYNDFVRYGY